MDLSYTGEGVPGYTASMLVLLLLLSCDRSVVALQVDARVACMGCPDGDVFWILPDCNPNRFLTDAGVVEVCRDRYDHRPEVAWSIAYEGYGTVHGVTEDTPAVIEGLLGPSLYEITQEGRLQPLPGAALVTEEEDHLIFDYPYSPADLPAAPLTVRESHTVTFRDELRLRGYRCMPCCGLTLGPASGILALLGALVASMRTRTR